MAAKFIEDEPAMDYYHVLALYLSCFEEALARDLTKDECELAMRSFSNGMYQDMISIREMMTQEQILEILEPDESDSNQMPAAKVHGL